MPENPSHEGLTSQGWNWTKAEIDDYLNDYPEATVNVGQMYITDDGKTRLYCEIREERPTIFFELRVNGEVEIDWGDGSQPIRWTGTSTSSAVGAVGQNHTYAHGGEYVITIKVISGAFVPYSGVNEPFIRKPNGSINGSQNSVYANCLKKAELGEGIDNLNNSFYGFNCLETVTIPNYTVMGNNSFSSCYSLKFGLYPPTSVTNNTTGQYASCYSLKAISWANGYGSFQGLNVCYGVDNAFIPKGVSQIASYAFSQTKIKNINIPNSVTKLGTSAFSNTYNLVTLTIPAGVTSIGNSCFSNNNGMKEYHFLSATPPTLGASAFQYIPSDCIIYVPMASVEAYRTATNWSTYASQIQGE